MSKTQRLLIKFLAGTLIGIMAGLLLTSAEASEFQVLQLKEVRVQYKRFVDPGRDALLYPEVHKEGLGVAIDTDVMRYLFWKSEVGALTTDAQYRAVWLEMTLGLRITQWLEVQAHHKSEHLLDRDHAFMDRFPVQDSVGFTLYLYRAQPGRSIF